MLNPSDVYVSGGSNNLLVCWTDKVTKYDASSFYNWEQDNLPLHDLDERTHLLWEKLGHPTSALTGMSFIVSGDATDSCNPLFFTTLSSCINALPEVINCPILIEVASFGNLGGLNLSNKAFGPNGALEIINRNSAFAYPRGLKSTNDEYVKLDYDTDYTAYGLASSVSMNGDSTFMTVLNSINARTPSPEVSHVFASAFTTYPNGDGIAIASGVVGSNFYSPDVRFVNPYVFARRIDDRYSNRLTASLSSTDAPWNLSNTTISSLVEGGLKFRPFDKDRTTEKDTYDVSTLNFISNVEEAWGHKTDSVGVAYGAMSFSYFNSLDYIKVNECNGPVYIRNFNVDGQHSVDRGIEINNSKVNLERCSVSRCNKAGLHAENSEVNILRGIVAFRNYELIGSTRTGTPFAEKRLAYKTQDSYGAGIYANNSTINFKSTYTRDVEKSNQASGSAHYANYMAIRDLAPNVSAGPFTPAPSLEALTCLSRNDIGIHAVNSKITGGRTELAGSSTVIWNDGMQLFSELNTEAGIKLENSVLDYSGRLLLDGNYFGLDSANSKVSVDTLAARYNQSTGINLTNSEFTYNKDLYGGYLHSLPDTSIADYEESQVACIKNGQDIVSDNSVIGPVYTSSMPSIYKMVYAAESFGKNQHDDQLLPSIHLKGNTDADLVHTHLERTTTGVSSTAQYGLMARVEDNSTLTMRGSKEYANIVIGPNNQGSNIDAAGLYASKGSNIKLQGPTSIVQLGIDALAEDNSTIEITPHQSSNGSLLVSSFDLNNGQNHTMVELHSTRSCLVANRNSNILMENVGHYSDKWNAGAYGSSITLPQDYTSPADAQYCASGFIQFYPNANVAQALAPNVKGSVTIPSSDNKYRFRSGTAPIYNGFIYDGGGDAEDASAVTTGGMCVRAVENSLVQANNVHFPATWPITSSIIYDYNGDAPLDGPKCSRLFIWNIADDSLLKASYISVKGLHPRDSGYVGPSGVWATGDVPSGTPDTGTLPVLDYYGQSTANPYGKSASGENFGAFRLYFSVDPATNFMVASGTNKLEGWARQVFAQGYNFSGNLIASGNADASSTDNHIGVLQKQADGSIAASGFYYASAMLATPNTVKAVLDDSALNTFANAKHNTVGKSGLGKVVQGYYATSAFGGDSYNRYDYGLGLASINNFDLKKDN